MTITREKWGRTPFFERNGKLGSVPIFSSGDDDHLALRLARSEQVQRFDYLLQRKRRGNVRLEPALAVPARKLVCALGEDLRLAPREIAPEDADDRRALQQREVERQLGDFTRGEPDDQQPAAQRARAERGLRVGAADGVVDDVDAFAVREVLDARAQVLGGVVDRLVGT